MKKLNVVLTSLLLMSASLAFCQEEVKKEKLSIEERSAKKLEKLDQEVKLTSEQREKISELNSSYVVKLETLRSDESIEKEEKKNKAKAIKKQWREDVKNELTEAQIETLKENHEKNKKSPEERAKLRVEKIDEVVGLNEYQKSDLESLHLETSQKIRDIKSTDGLDDETKKAKIKEVKNASKDRLEEILDEEQLAKLKEHRKQKRSERK